MWPRLLVTLFIAVSATPASAQLAEPVRVMIEAAIAKGDKAQIEAVVTLARETQPKGLAEIEQLHNAWLEADRAATAALAASASSVELQPAVRLTGKGEIGGFRATGNGTNSGISASLTLERQAEDWSHKITARADYQRAGDRTTREQFLVAYEPRYAFSDRLFVYGLTQVERDRVQGFSARLALSGGIGYDVFDRDRVDLAVKLGPAVRVARYTSGGGDTRLAGLVGLDFDWRITDRLTFNHDANAVAETGGGATLIIDSANTSLDLVTGLDAKLTERWSTRISYAIDYDSNPPAGGVTTDTLTRISFVYGF